MIDKEAVALAISIKNNIMELNDWVVKLNKTKRSFGRCNYDKKEIQLSSYLIPYMSDESIKDTIVHEIAHALTYGHGHDYYWSILCVQLGGTGKRLGGTEKFNDGKNGQVEYYKKTAKYTLTCPVCGSESFVNRLPKFSYSCGKHGKGFNPLYTMVVTVNR